MKKIVINNDNRRFNISSIVVGYLEENKEEVLEFEIPEKYAEYGKKACFSANGQTFAKNFDDIISNKLTITRDISQFKELDMTIAFFKIENEDEIVARTSILHILIENAIICNDDVSPDEPKIIILDKLIDEVTKVGLEVEKKGNYAKEQGDYAKSQAENVISANTEAIKIINNFENNVEAYTTSFNENANNKTTDFDSNAESKTRDFNQNVDNKISEYNNNASEKLSAYNTNATSKVNDYNTNASAKLQEYNTNSDNKIAEYDLHSQELDNKIIATRNELERVKNDVLETGTDTDTFVHLEDSAMAEYQELSIDGVCEQETTTGANLCNLNVVQDSRVVYNSDGTITINGAGGFSLKFSDYTFKANTTYYMKWELVMGSVNQEQIFMVPDATSFAKKDTFTPFKFDSDTVARGFWIHGGALLTNAIIRIWFSETQTDFEPYTGGQPSPSPDYPQSISTIENNLKITSCNKNIFDFEKFKKDNSNISIEGDNTNFTIKTMDKLAKIFLPKVKNVITVSGKVSSTFVNGSGSIVYKDGTKESLFQGWNNAAIEETVFAHTNSTTKEVDYISIISFGVNSNWTIKDFQIKYGENDNSFEQHLETQITANLPEGEFIGKINDTYKDTLKVEYNEEDGQYHLVLNKRIGKVVLNSSEIWTLSASGFILNDGEAYKHFKNRNKNIFDGSCNYFTVEKSSTTWTKINRCGWNTKGTFWIMDDHKLASTVDDFKTWLSTHNTEVYYALETPYVVDLGIVDMPITYNEITNLFTDSDLMPNINAKYYRNFISTVRNLQVNEKALKQELVDINTRLSALESASASVVSESEVVE